MAGITETNPQSSALEQYTLALRMQRKILKEQQNPLAQEIREHVRSQKPLWNQIPNLALEADGRSGYGDSTPYYYKVWNLQNGPSIDLTTGEIIIRSFTSSRKEPELASDENVVRLAEKLDNLDAGKIIKYLQTESEEEYFGGYNPRKTAQWRADIRAEDPFLLETLDPSLTLEGQAEKLRCVISKIEETTLLSDSELTIEQAKNAIGHVLRASDFDDREDGSQPIELDIPIFNEARAMGISVPPLFPPPLTEVRGAQEIMQSLSFYIEIRSLQFSPLFAKLSETIWHTAVNATAKVRHERGMKHYPKAEWIYPTLGEQYIKRAEGNVHMFALAPKEPLMSDTEIGSRGILTALKVADWFLNTSFDN